MVTEGAPAPDFELPNGDGDTMRLSELRGRPVVLYFYPKDDTPGCTAEACEFRDAYAEFERHGAVVLGVSPDSEARTRGSRPSTAYPSRCSRTPSTRSRSATASGSRRPWADARRWGSSARPSLSTSRGTWRGRC